MWRVWRPCGCAEGCVRVSPADAVEGAEVTVHESWMREGARPMEDGTRLRVESAEGTEGTPVLVVSHLEGLCGYLCQTEFAGPVAPNACANGQLESPPVAVAPSPSFPPCGTRTRSAPMLERYDQLVQGARFHVLLQYDSNMSAWAPSPALGMPMHHASSLAYIDFTLPPQGPGTLDLDVEAVEILREAPRDGTFFVTYRVRVVSACTAG